MALIKFVALDVYGTILESTDYYNILPFRKGLDKFFEICANRQIKIITASDCDAKDDLLKTAKNNPSNAWFSINKLAGIYKMIQNPKEFGVLSKTLGIVPSELFVIGDGQKDIEGAIKYKCPYYHIYPYTCLQTWDHLGKGMTSFDDIIERNKKLFE